MTQRSAHDSATDSDKRPTVHTRPVPGFDRIKPADAPGRASVPAGADARDDDVQGKRALFSGAAQPPSMGSVAIECGGCSNRSVVSFVRLAKLWATGIYVPRPGANQRAWLKCPACSKHEWVTLNLKA